jgi:HK97 family phage major capsid protein
MDKIQDLQEKRQGLVDEMNKLIESVDNAEEKRDFSPEERTKLEGFQSEIREVDEVITLRKQAEVINAKKAESRGRELGKEDKRNLEKFNLGVFVRNLSEGRAMEGIYAEMAQEGAKEASEAGISSRGIMLPRFALESRDMTAEGGTSLNQGGMTIETNKATLLDALFDRNVLVQAGATVLNGLTGNVDIPRLVSGTQPVKKAENAQAVEYTATTAMLELQPRRLPTVIEVSNQLIRQSNSQPLTTIIQRHLENFLMQAMQQALIEGTGTNEPVGILGTTGIGDVTGDTNGAAPDYADIVNIVKEVAVDNADFGSLYFLINAATEAKLKQTAKIASSDSFTLIDPRAPGTLDSRPYLVTNSVPSDLTKGSSSGVCSAIIYGNFNDFVIANWGGVEFLVNPYSKDDYGLTRINASVYYDGGVMRPQSFSAKKDVLTA